jgi:RNA polymerase primary sigma factor
VLGLPRKKLPIIKKAIKIYNLTPQTDQAEVGWSLGEMVMDENTRTPEDELVENDNLTHVMQQLETMDPREATVLKMRFGLHDHEPCTLKEIGESLGLTRERVRQIETEALGKLAESLNGPVESMFAVR